MNDKARHRRTLDVSQRLLRSLDYSKTVLLGSPVTGRAARMYFDATIAHATGTMSGLPREVSQAMQRLPPNMQREVAFSGQDAAIRALWEQARVVYEVDGDAWESIGDAEPGSVIPKEVVQHLPHPNPLLVFPEPILIDHGQRERQRFVGVYVSGCHTPQGLGRTTGVDDIDRRMNSSAPPPVVLCSTHDPQASGWTLTFAGLVESASGKPRMVNSEVQDVMWTRSTILLTGSDTLRSLTERSVAKFDTYRDPKLGLGDHEKDLPVLLARAINMIIYLCARNADLQPIPHAVPSGRNARRSILLNEDEPPQVIGVGYRVGAQLREWKRTQRKQGPGAGTGKKIAPHIRRSHPHTFRYGPGRASSYVKWLWPIPVNMRPGEATETTIIPIKGDS